MEIKLIDDDLEFDENVVSLEDIDDVGDIIEREYVEVEDEVEQPDVLGLWDRDAFRGTSMLDRQTLMDMYGENEYDTM
jgi:hypothetical protein